ncbi:SGNH/GDSL hydrolase family protein [Bifidobacterium simiarum]|nr:SGNH/GDSL hydrolase family protein [Bifidobacterium simiarum]MBT1167149.1 SGNH/GDSL hydrolase family protein [Bifidobacterium simiarum]
MTDSPDSPLNGKVLYAFGDSIIDGHLYTRRSCVNVVAEREGLTLVKAARNGATIRYSTVTGGLGGQILQQAELIGVDQPKPDVIIFNGGANDAWPETIPAYLGAVGEAKDPAELDLNTYAGCFEATILAFRRHWPDVPIVYLAVAKIGRDWAVQNYLRQVQLAACAKWGVTVADVFGDTDLDARNEDMRVRYSFDMIGTDGLPGTPETAVYPDPDVHPSGTHPNLAGIDRYYAPIITKALRKALGVGLGD